MENMDEIRQRIRKEGEESLTMDEWFESWLSEYKQLTIKKGTVENYRRNIEIILLIIFLI